MKKGTGYKKELKFSVLKLDPKDKETLEKLSSELGMSLTQIIVFGALRGTQLEIPVQNDLSASVQIRLTKPIHSELEKISSKTNRPMTEIIMLGIESAFDLKLKRAE